MRKTNLTYINKTVKHEHKHIGMIGRSDIARREDRELKKLTANSPQNERQNYELQGQSLDFPKMRI